MKKILWLLALCPLLAIMSCSDDDAMPDVQLSVDYAGAVAVDGKLYAVRGDTIEITGLYVTPAPGTKNAILGTTSYYWDYQLNDITAVMPFATWFATGRAPLGFNRIDISTTIAQENKQLMSANITIPVILVENPDQLPQPQLTGNTITCRVN